MGWVLLTGSRLVGDESNVGRRTGTGRGATSPPDGLAHLRLRLGLRRSRRRRRRGGGRGRGGGGGVGEPRCPPVVDPHLDLAWGWVRREGGHRLLPRDQVAHLLAV